MMKIDQAKRAAPNRQTGNIRIAPVLEARERHAVERLRYDVYVRELGYDQPYADHRAHTLPEPLDATSVVFGAFNSTGAAVATLRVTHAVNAEEEYGDLFGWNSLPPSSRREHAMASKLIVVPELRGGSLALRIIRTAAEHLMSEGIRFCHLETYDHLVPLYSRLGFLTLGRRWHAPYGEVSHLRIDFTDIELSRALRSPLLPVIERARAASSEAA